MTVKPIETPAIRVPRVRFTIRRLMIAVVVIAGLLVIPFSASALLLVLSLPCLALLGAQWLAARGHRRLAALCFGGLATLTNVLYVVACVYPHYLILPGLFYGWLLIVLPTIAAVGGAWARLATRDDRISRYSSPAAWLRVLALSLLPVATLWTLWPLHLAFLTSRPTLERLADQVAAGRAVGLPQRAGLFQVVRIDVDPLSGNVGLIVDPHSGGPTGLVRINPRRPSNRRGPISCSGLKVDLGWGWEYRQED